jgi:DNA excision repair protein ERCC-2
LLAPNGTGKTIIALCGLLPLAYDKNLKIIYMCRTHSQNTRVIKELTKISKKLIQDNANIQLNGISIRGRNEMCLNQTLLSLKLNPKDSMSVCSDLRKNKNCTFFLNLLKQKEKYENLTFLAPETFQKPFDAEDLLNFCRENKICPYFLSKFLLKDMRIIICNYQWVFNPFIAENFLDFIDQELSNCILVLDECHNLIDIATEVNSDRLTPYFLRLCLKDLEMYRSPILMQSFVKILLNLLKENKERLRTEEKGVEPYKILDLTLKKLGLKDLNELKIFLEDLYDFGFSINEEKLADGQISRNYIGSLADFWKKWLNSYYLENYFFCFNIRNSNEKKSISLEIVALDPREVTIPILRKVYTCLSLSGTVNPYVYNKLVGLNESGKRYKGIITNSPFKKENIRALIIRGIDTKRDNRNPALFNKMILKIEEVLQCTPANVGIFCASYKILNGLIYAGIESIINKNKKQLFVEEPGLSASQNARIVNNFKSMALNEDIGGVLLGVCGGRNSEGEDYPGAFMNAVIIAGFPYHIPTPRVEAKIKYYNKVFNKQGWNFAYLYPAVQRANQASGRPIRKINDKGAIIFLDSRFIAKSKWISEWIKKELKIIPDRPNAITQELSPFWNSD